MMKGLILKDFYAIRAYFMFLAIVDLFIIILGAVSDNGGFWIMYPCILSGMIAVSLISYEEKEKWDVYSRTLPYKKSELVLGKYITSLIVSLLTVVLVAIAQGISMAVKNSFDITSLLTLCAVLTVFSLLPSAFLMPMIYKFGIEKGRIAYYIVVGAFTVFGSNDKIILTFYSLSAKWYFPFVILLIGFALYVGSYFLSVFVYVKKKYYEERLKTSRSFLKARKINRK